MEFMLPLPIPDPGAYLAHGQKVLSIGSCFTEHIGTALKDLKFDVLQNPNGILFDPASVCRALLSYIYGETYTAKDLFFLHEVWHSWQHHSRFSGTDAALVLEQINDTQAAAHRFLKEADWLVITLGSSYSYRLV